MSNDMPFEQFKEMEALKQFSAEIAKTNLQPGQYNAVIRAYKDLRIYQLCEEKAKIKNNEKPETPKKSWEKSSLVGVIFILISFIFFANYVSNKFFINLSIVGSLLLFIIGILLIFTEKLKQRIL